MNATITINTAGACVGNPGPGGFAAIIALSDSESITLTGGDPDTTNNRMELAAVLEAIRTLNTIDDAIQHPINVRSDSPYVINAFKEGWVNRWLGNGWRTSKRLPVANQDLWHDLIWQIEDHPMHWECVQDYSGNPRSAECESLATAEAAFAPNTDTYWVSTSSPRSVTATYPEAPPETESESLKNAMHIALMTSPNFSDFREQMLEFIQPRLANSNT